MSELEMTNYIRQLELTETDKQKLTEMIAYLSQELAMARGTLHVIKTALLQGGY